MITLRDYQERALVRLRDAVRAGARRVLLVAPTGSGKTVIAVASIQRTLAAGKRVLVCAHRQELLNQFHGALKREGIAAGVIRADDERTDPSLPVQLASVDTLDRRDKPAADVVWIDEAHRTPADRYQRILAGYPEARIFGLTATPCRLDGKPLKEHFDTMIEVASYSELIAAEHIWAPIVYAPERPPDLSKVKRVAGDYDLGALERTMSKPSLIGDVVEEWKKHAGGRSTVVFAVGIEHSKSLVDAFRSADVRAVHLDAQSTDEERLGVLVSLERRDIQVVCNVGILCEGWDQPSVKCCVMARPTLSLTLHMQTSGRILRPWGDQAPVLLDHAGNVERHGLPHEDREWSLEAGTAERKGDIKCRICPKCYAYGTKSPCEYCGYALPVQTREVRTAEGRLVEVSPPQPFSSPEERLFAQESDRALVMGFKPGYASAKYKEKYDKWPPWAWSQKLLAQYAADPDWQERVRQRTVQREKWQKTAPAESLRDTVPAGDLRDTQPSTFEFEDL